MLSLLQNKWYVVDSSPDLVDKLVRGLNLSTIVARLLVNRKVQTPEEGQIWVQPDLSRLHDPFLMLGMQEAADRIVRAIESGEIITVFCDYDVDGVTSAAFLTHFFRDLGVRANYYLPERLSEGYGLNTDAIQKIRKGGSTLMITADCGITGNREVKLAQEIGLDVIISDHHQVGEEGLPEAVAVLNPHRKDCGYPFKFLAGVGIAFKIATAVRTTLYRNGWEKDRLPNLRRHLDLFALGTIADVAPMTGENHILSRHGLEVLETSSKPGLVALKAVSGLNGKITARSVGFGLGPRLNAAGRLGKADTGFHLLTSLDQKEAMDLARKLDQVNQERKEIQNATQEEAEYQLERQVDPDRDRVIVLASENFHSGVIGIAASRLVQKYYRPVVLIALEEGKGKGSARSIPAFNLFKAFSECAKNFEQFGGHAYAAGFTILEDQIDPLRQAINEVGHRILSEEDLVPEIKIDAPLDLGEISRDLFREIELLEPFGAENPSPVFLSRNVRIQNLRTMGKNDDHVRFRAVQGSGKMDVVGFNMGTAFAGVDPKDGEFDLAYEIQINDWQGQDKLELKLIDLR